MCRPDTHGRKTGPDAARAYRSSFWLTESWEMWTRPSLAAPMLTKAPNCSTRTCDEGVLKHTHRSCGHQEDRGRRPFCSGVSHKSRSKNNNREAARRTTRPSSSWPGFRADKGMGWEGVAAGSAAAATRRFTRATEAGLIACCLLVGALQERAGVGMVG